jgi:recombination protein RecT
VSGYGGESTALGKFLLEKKGRIVMDVKEELAAKAQKPKLTKNMSIADMIKALEPEIAKALPSVITPERFTRMALSALNNTPKLAECTQMSFLAALMNAAQLGLEPNTPLGQAYLIPYKNKGILECQFQIGYKGLLDLVYRNDMVQTVQAQTVYANDTFAYSLGLDSDLRHVPTLTDRGEAIAFYAFFKLNNGGYGFEVMGKPDMDDFAKKYSKGISSEYSPWNTNYEDMAKKTVIKKVLKYAPLKSDFQKALSNDGTIKTELSLDMSEVEAENIIDVEEGGAVETVA